MSESFVDLSYRGLSLGKRLKLTDVRPSSGYVEMPMPMPVGTAIAITTDQGVELAAVVAAIHEQVGGSDRPPGMLLKPKLEGAAGAWWNERVTLPEIEKVVTVPPPTPEVAPATAKPPVVVVTRRVTKPGVAVPELLDDGQDTGVMDAIDPEMIEQVEQVDSTPVVVDDGKQTTMMDAVDLAALGIDPNAPSKSGELPAIREEDLNGNGNGNGDKSDGKSRKKRKKR